MQNKLDCLKLINFIEKSPLFKNHQIQNKKILIAFSGGQDSTCLLTIFYILSQKWGFQLGAIYCNHCWTSSRSASFAVFQNLKKFKIPFYFVEARNSQAMKPEQTARKWRYSSFYTVLKSDNYDFLFTGHTLSDCAETTLFNLARGSGIKGVCSLKEYQIFSETDSEYGFKKESFHVSSNSSKLKLRTWADKFPLSKGRFLKSFDSNCFKKRFLGKPLDLSNYHSLTISNRSKFTRKQSLKAQIVNQKFVIRNVRKIFNLNNLNLESQVNFKLCFDPFLKQANQKTKRSVFKTLPEFFKKLKLATMNKDQLLFNKYLEKLEEFQKQDSLNSLITCFQTNQGLLDSCTLNSSIQRLIIKKQKEKLENANFPLKRKNSTFIYQRPFNQKIESVSIDQSSNSKRVLEDPDLFKEKTLFNFDPLSLDLQANQFLVFRPLIRINRETLASFSAQLEISIHYDKSNKDLSLTRNYIRKLIIPLLKKINPYVEENIFKFSKILEFYYESFGDLKCPRDHFDMFKQ